MSAQITAIGWFQLSLATFLILMTGFISMLMSLGLGRTLLIATVRTYLQLIALGLALDWIFKGQAAWITLGVFLLMMLLTAYMALERIKKRPPGLYGPTLITVIVTGLIVTFSVTHLIIQVEPWYDPRYLLSIGGMILGNIMNSIALTVERLFDDLRKRVEEVHQALAFGGTPWEVSLPSLRTALLAGLMPTINTMSAVGLVHIPGVMTGQLLAGAPPIEAAKYQIVVMLMISAATALAAMGSAYLVYRRAFDKEWRFVLVGERL